jgi:hypothetical protein
MLHLALALLVMTTIKGEVLFDGTPLPGATVILTSGNGVKRVTVSDMNGRYRFDRVEGPYKVDVEMTGFAVLKSEGTTIEMKAAIQEPVCHDFCDDGWDQRPGDQPAKFSPPRAMRLPVSRGFAGALDLAPGAH